MKVVLFWAVGILIPIIGLQAEEVIDDMVILEGTSIKNFFIFDLCLKNTVCLNFPLFSFFFLMLYFSHLQAKIQA